MLPAVVPFFPKDVPVSPLFQVPRGESKADGVTPPSLTDAGKVLEEPDVLNRKSMDDVQYVAPSSNDCNASSDLVSDGGRRSVWGRTSNGANDVTAVVMGGSVSWPALTESAKTSTKTSVEGLIPAVGHVNSTPTHQNSAKHADGGNGDDGVGTSGSFSSNGGDPVNCPPSSLAERQQNIPNRPIKVNYNNRDGGRRESHGWTDQADRHRRFGDGSNRGYHGNRRDQVRGVNGWNSFRAFNGRDFHMQQGHQRPPMPPMPPMPPIPPMAPMAPMPPMPPMPPMAPMPPMGSFTAPFPVQRFPVPMTYTDFSSQGYYFPTSPHPQVFEGFPYVPHATISPIQQQQFFEPTNQLRTSLLKQIEYYFSVENLCKDEYLRKNMDDHGWVSIFLIADFKRVKLLTDNVQLILDVLRSSEVVEVQGNGVRRREGWSKWILRPPQNQTNSRSDPPPTTTSPQSLLQSMAGISLKE